MSAKTVIGTRQGGGFSVKFKGYDSILVDAVREIRGRKYDPATKTWNLPATRVAAEGLIDLAESYGATIEEVAISALEALAGRTIEPEGESGLFIGDNSKPSGFPPTDEQRAVIESAQAGGDLKVSAYAGAGKTSTLVLIAKALAPRMGVYIAYNRAIADEAQEKFPGNVECRTAHSFAYQAMDAGRVFKEKLRQKLYPRRVAELLSIPFSGFGDRTQINCARAVQATVRAFMQTADEAIFPKHIPDLHLQAFPVPAEGAVDPRTEADMKQKRAAWMRFVTSGARDLWELQIDPKRDDVGMTHDHYLKLWQLSKPSLAVDFILFDESQDANPVLLDIVTQQKAQKVWVGDTHQCQPAGEVVLTTEGWIDIHKLNPEEHRVVCLDRHGSTLVGFKNGYSFQKSVRQYSGNLFTIVGSGFSARCTPNHSWPVKWSDSIDRKEIRVTYLMRQGNRYRVGWCQLFGKCGLHLGMRSRHNKADAAWILEVHTSKQDASISEAVIAASFGLPTIMFEPTTSNVNIYTKEAIDRVFNEIGDLTQKAKECLEVYELDLKHPFYDSAKYNERQGYRTSLDVAACNLLPGLMHVAVPRSNTRSIDWVAIESIGCEYVVDLPVYSLDVDKHHNYLTGHGVVTNNSIYQWRGSINAMDLIPATELHITQSFRWGPAVADVANAILNFKTGGLEHPVRGFDRKKTVLGPVSGKHTLICRGNGRLFASALEAVRCGQRIAVVGSLEDAISMMESGYALSLGDMENVKHADLKAFQTWEELTQASEEDHNLENLVKHIEEYGSQIPNICADLRAAGECSEAQADLILTTCHKAKGREWPQVRLAPDYPNQVRNMQEGKPIDLEELNVLYVAATRATERLETNYQVDCLMSARIDSPFSNKETKS